MKGVQKINYFLLNATLPENVFVYIPERNDPYLIQKSRKTGLIKNISAVLAQRHTFLYLDLQFRAGIKKKHGHKRM